MKIDQKKLQKLIAEFDKDVAGEGQEVSAIIGVIGKKLLKLTLIQDNSKACGVRERYKIVEP